ncbi:hypothetical protein D0Y65_024344 [Glycine soja]|uniref:Uncharacterized protein n=1 Tax=Glycine soja TaxID=3848 RepID=A0A445J1M6_GLYSO|nr:hypothetical protein D0Y65_024344 [Glycine soja]
MAMLFDSFVVVCLPSTTFSLVDDHQTFVKLLRYAGLRLRLIATMRKCDTMKRRWIEEEKSDRTPYHSDHTMANNNEEEEEEVVVQMVKLGSYGGEVRLVVGDEESVAEETMLLWGVQEPTLSKPKAFVSQASLQLSLDSCGHSLSILQSPSTLIIHISALASTIAYVFSNRGTWTNEAVMWDSGIVLEKVLEDFVDSGMLC